MRVMINPGCPAKVFFFCIAKHDKYQLFSYKSHVFYLKGVTSKLRVLMTRKDKCCVIICYTKEWSKQCTDNCLVNSLKHLGF